jgi:outer membrane protein assembly factor BamB
MSLTERLCLLFFLSVSASGLAIAANEWAVLEDLADATAAVRAPNADVTAKPAPHVIRRFPLDDAAFQTKGGLLPDTVLGFAPDSRTLAIGTYFGQVSVRDVYSGTTVWEKRIPEGMIKSLDFSADGAMLFYGEQSVDGFVYGADAKTGGTLWRYRLADDLESGAPPSKDDWFSVYALPSAFRIQALADGDALVLGVHSWGNYLKPETQQRLSRLYRFGADGRLLWAFPRDGALPMTIIYADADPEGKRVAFLTTDKGANATEEAPCQSGALYVLNGADGTITGHHVFEPLAPHFDTVWFWQSVSVSADGTLATVGLLDGRSFLFDLETAEPAQEFTFGAPVMMGDIPVAANATYTRIAPDGMTYFQTGNSSVPSGTKPLKVAAPPGPHPNANMITAVDKDGKPRWRYRSGHHYQNVWTSADGRWLITVAERDDPEAGRDAGIMLFDTQRPGGGASKFVYYYQVEGTCFFNAAISADGGAIALTEAPYVDPKTNMLVGTYQVHVIR